MVVGWLGIFFFKCCFTSTETIRLTVGTWSPGRPPRPEHSSWALRGVLMIAFIQQYSSFSTLEQTHCAFVAYDSKWVTVAFYSAFWMSTEVVYLHLVLVVSWLVPYGSATVSARSVHIAQPCTICHVTSGRSRLAQAGRFGPLKVIHTLPLLLWLWVFYWVRINLYDAWGPTWKLS